MPSGASASRPDARRTYEDALERAFGFAARHVAWDQALEIAHDVASDMLALPADRVTSALIYRAVVNRLRNLWRASQRRSAAERVHHDRRAEGPAARVDASTDMETRELRDVIETTIANMPETMREAFALVREHDLSYKEAAAHLGIAVGTVHTHLSRANLLLRDAIEAYRRSGARPHARTEQRA
jgi:RNA polymerase sigma factor (sigma-70 family)